MPPVLANVTVVAIGGRAVLMEGPPGSGKSSLALALIDRGAVLVGDDAVTLETRDGIIMASPPPNTAGLLEIRNLGPVAMPCAPAPLALAILLDTTAERLPDSAEERFFAGIAIPCVRLYPDTPWLALRAEQALARFGLPFSTLPSHSIPDD